jgi:hypothetical protein
VAEEEPPVRKGMACPRCGRPIDWVGRQIVRGRVYYYAVHVSYENGRKRLSKCYLGPRDYDYVSRQHSDIGMALKGMVYEAINSPASRFRDYVAGIVDKLSGDAASGALNLGQARDWARAAREAGQLLLRLADGLEGYARRLEAEGKAEEKAGAVAKGEGEARAAPAPAGPLTAEY